MVSASPSAADQGAGDEGARETLVFQQKVSKGAVRFIVFTAAGLGFAMCAGFFAQLNNLQPDDYVTLVLGFVFLGFARLFHRFSHLPRFVLTPRELQIRGFFRVWCVDYDRLVGLGSFGMKFRPRDGRYRKMEHTVYTEHLELRLKDGSKKTVVLPTFMNAKRMLDALCMRCGLKIEALPNVDKT